MSKCNEVRIKGDLCGINEADIREELEARGWTPVRVEFSRPERCFLVRFQNAVVTKAAVAGGLVVNGVSLQIEMSSGQGILSATVTQQSSDTTQPARPMTGPTPPAVPIKTKPPPPVVPKRMANPKPRPASVAGLPIADKLNGLLAGAVKLPGFVPGVKDLMRTPGDVSFPSPPENTASNNTEATKAEVMIRRAPRVTPRKSRSTSEVTLRRQSPQQTTSNPGSQDVQILVWGLEDDSQPSVSKVDSYLRQATSCNRITFDRSLHGVHGSLLFTCPDSGTADKVVSQSGHLAPGFQRPLQFKRLCDTLQPNAVHLTGLPGNCQADVLDLLVMEYTNETAFRKPIQLSSNTQQAIVEFYNSEDTSRLISNIADLQESLTAALELKPFCLFTTLLVKNLPETTQAGEVKEHFQSPEQSGGDACVVVQEGSGMAIIHCPNVQVRLDISRRKQILNGNVLRVTPYSIDALTSKTPLGSSHTRTTNPPAAIKPTPATKTGPTANATASQVGQSKHSSVPQDQRDDVYMQGFMLVLNLPTQFEEDKLLELVGSSSSVPLNQIKLVESRFGRALLEISAGFDFNSTQSNLKKQQTSSWISSLDLRRIQKPRHVLISHDKSLAMTGSQLATLLGPVGIEDIQQWTATSMRVSFRTPEDADKIIKRPPRRGVRPLHVSAQYDGLHIFSHEDIQEGLELCNSPQDAVSIRITPGCSGLLCGYDSIKKDLTERLALPGVSAYIESTGSDSITLAAMAEASLVWQWQEVVKREMEEFLKLVVVQKISVTPSVFEQYLEEDRLTGELSKGVDIGPDDEPNILILTGMTDAVERCKNGIKKKVDVERAKLHKMDTKVLHIAEVAEMGFLRSTLSDKLTEIEDAQHVKITLPPKDRKHGASGTVDVTIAGQVASIAIASERLLEAVRSIMQFPLNFAKSQQSLMASIPGQEYIEDFFRSSPVHLNVIKNPDQSVRMKLLLQRSDLESVEEQVQQLFDLFDTEHISVDDRCANAIAQHNWSVEVLEKVKNAGWLVGIEYSEAEKSLVICGLKNEVGDSRRLVEQYFATCGKLKTEVRFKGSDHMALLQTRQKSDFDALKLKFGGKSVKFITDSGRSAILLDGPEAEVQEAVTALQKLAENFHVLERSLEKQGLVSHVSQDDVQRQLADAGLHHGTIVKVLTGADAPISKKQPVARSPVKLPVRPQPSPKENDKPTATSSDTDSVQSLSPEPALKQARCVVLAGSKNGVQTESGMRIKIEVGNIASAKAAALVNPTQPNLIFKDHGRVPQAISAAAGPYLQAHCTELVKNAGPIMIGKFARTDAYRLNPVQKLYHCAVPPYNGKYSVKVLRALLLSVLEDASNFQLKSVAIPSVVDAGNLFSAGRLACMLMDLVVKFAEDNPKASVREVIIYVPDEASLSPFKREIDELCDGAPFAVDTASQPASQPQVEVIQGDIVKETTDVIVTTALSHLDMSKVTMANAVLKAAGSRVQTQLNNVKTIQSVKPGDILRTGSGTLNVKYILHAVLEERSKTNGKQFLQGTVLKCLLEAEKAGVSSIAIPALGAGGLGFSPAEAAEATINAIQIFIRGDSVSLVKSLKIIRLVMFDAKHVQPFQQEANQLLSATSGGAGKHADRNSRALPGSSVTLSVYRGDLVNENVDAIVITELPGLDMAAGLLSKTVASHAGLEVQSALNTTKALKTVDVGSICITTAGNLLSKYILHAVMTDATSTGGKDFLEGIVRSCLERIEELSLTSVAFPALGAGGLGYTIADSAEATRSAIEKYVSKKSKSTSIKEIRLVLFDTHHVRPFKDIVQRSVHLPQLRTRSIRRSQHKKALGKVSAEQVVVDLDAALSGSSTTQMGESAEAKRKQLREERMADRVQEEMASEDVHFKIFAPNSKMALATFERVRHIIDTTFSVCRFEEKDISLFLEEDDALIDKYCLQCGVLVTHGSDSSITLYGATRNVQEVGVQILQLCRKVAEEKLVLFREVSVKRKSETPHHWKTDGVTLELVTLRNGDDEFEYAASLFHTTCPNDVITQIQRVENAKLWIAFYGAVKSLRTEKCKSPLQIKELWHGTAERNISKLYSSGWDKNYAGKNAVKYGKGMYFARDAAYSRRYATEQNQGASAFHMIMAYVAIRDVRVGTKGMIAPPDRDQNRPEEGLVSATVDSLADPSIFVTYTAPRAYPAYVLTFH